MARRSYRPPVLVSFRRRSRSTFRSIPLDEPPATLGQGEHEQGESLCGLSPAARRWPPSWMSSPTGRRLANWPAGPSPSMRHHACRRRAAIPMVAIPTADSLTVAPSPASGAHAHQALSTPGECRSLSAGTSGITFRPASRRATSSKTRSTPTAWCTARRTLSSTRGCACTALPTPPPWGSHPRKPTPSRRRWTASSTHGAARRTSTARAS